MVARRKPSIGTTWVARVAHGAFLRWRIALTSAVRRVTGLGAAIGSRIAQARRAIGLLLALVWKTAFTRWRAALTRFVAHALKAVRSLRIDGIARAARAWARPSAAPDVDLRDVPAAVAASACLIAAAAGFAAAAGLRSGPSLWSYGTGVVVWSAARFALLRALAPSAGIDAGAASVSWAISLPPFALGAVPGLGLAALALSAVLAYRALVSFGASRRDALRATAWTYAAHAMGVAAATIAGAVLSG
ncbi:MAG: hypothetical protein QMD96_04415 [Anaerosomatales bacterium]|nr:hypothetical protein [Anaerosomatales bacterium]